MKSLIRCGATAVAVALAVAVAAPAFAANITVGEFVQRLAIVKNLDATDARVATDSLRTAGMRLPDLDLNAQLTESHVVAISQAAGLRLTSSNPDQVFESEQVDSFFVAFSSELVEPTVETADDGWPSENGPPFDPWTKAKGWGWHKGWGKGHQSPTEPE